MIICEKQVVKSNSVQILQTEIDLEQPVANMLSGTNLLQKINWNYNLQKVVWKTKYRICEENMTYHNNFLKAIQYLSSR